MLARKRGALRDRGRKMKKTTATALQTDVTTDDEWEKILERDGLVLVDIYCDWSGPCTSMLSVLKKIKIEVGGDILSYATARSDNITALSRFRGKSEPTWMFLRGGKMINFFFGANCPKITELLLKELKRIKSNQAPEFLLPVTEVSPVEAIRIKAFQEANAIIEGERIAREEAIARKKYKAQLVHLVEVLCHETCIILFPWIFKDEEGNKIEKEASPTYVELTEHVLPKEFRNEQMIEVEFDDESLENLLKEGDYEFNPISRKLICDGTCVCFRLRRIDKSSEIDVDITLMDLLYGEPVIPATVEDLIDGCFIEKNLPPIELSKDASSTISNYDKQLLFSTVWVPVSAKNKAVVFFTLFDKYIEATYPFEDEDEEIPITLFKYDSPRLKQLQVVMSSYASEVLKFGVFERDTLPNPKLIAISIAQFDNEIQNKTSYEVFVCVIRKISNEAFLSFAGIGPYYVSETNEIAKEDVEQYFPTEPEEEELEEYTTQQIEDN